MNKVKVIFICLLILISITEQQRKRKKQKKEKKTEDPLRRRPESVKPELYCDACIAIIKEATKELRGKKKESDVIDYMTDICNPEKYYVYSHPPPEMRTGCDAFVAGWDEEIERVLTNRDNDQKPIDQLCYQISKACVNVDPTNVERMPNEIFMDGQPKKIKDGKLADDEDL
jgi:hypothetical protein